MTLSPIAGDLDWRNSPAGKLDPELRIRLVKRLIGNREHSAEIIREAGEALMRMNIMEIAQVEAQMNLAAAAVALDEQAYDPIWSD